MSLALSKREVNKRKLKITPQQRHISTLTMWASVAVTLLLMLVRVNTETCQDTIDGEKMEGFLCASGECIYKVFTCDGFKHCKSGDDEENCPMCKGGDTFRCNDGRCVRKYDLCNGYNNCEDGSDEAVCDQCPVLYEGASSYKCEDSTLCIDETYVMDGIANCPNEDDEELMECPKDRPYLCDKSRCLSLDHLCDGIKDCSSGEDEKDCHPCPPDRPFHCDKTRCLSVDALCNVHASCNDMSDERNCTTCSGSTPAFHCKDGQCIEVYKTCDGNYDCLDKSDETIEACPPCGPLKAECNDGTCISSNNFCDGIVHCPDSSDEEDCGYCSGQSFLCNSLRCIQSKLLCNGVDDCGDGSDETDCTPCPQTKFRCSDKACIEKSKVCDRVADCDDASDEEMDMCFFMSQGSYDRQSSQSSSSTITIVSSHVFLTTFSLCRILYVDL